MKTSLFDKTSSFPSDDFRSRNYSGKWQHKFIDEYVDSIFAKGIDQAHQDFSASKNEHLPDSLYKFYPPSVNSLISIQNGRVFLSSPRHLNDPFDGFICVDDQPYIKAFVLKAIRDRRMVSRASTSSCISHKDLDTLRYAPISGRYNADLGYSDDFKSRLWHMYQNKSHEFAMKINSILVEAIRDCDQKVHGVRNMPFRITCFSNFDQQDELGKNTTMWSHYAGNHTGFCVKYSMNWDGIDGRDVIKCGLFPVIYTSRVPKLTLRDFKKLSLCEDGLETTPAVLKKMYKALITKSRFWSYEREWRLIIDPKDEVRLSNETLPFLDIEAIYLGCRMAPSLKKSLVQFAETHDIDVCLAKQSEQRFELDFYHTSLKKMKEDEYYSKLATCNQIKDEIVRLRSIRLIGDDAE